MSSHEGHHWIAISDMLSGFVVVLLLMFVSAAMLPHFEAEATEVVEARNRDQAMRALAEAVKPYTAQGIVSVDMTNKRLDLNDASFQSGSACLDVRAGAAMAAVAPIVANMLTTSPNLTIYVEGHTDPAPIRGLANGCGWFADNTQLSTVRAANVRTRIAEHLPATTRARMPVSGWGPERLRNSVNVLAAENRRVEMRFVWDDAPPSTPHPP